MENKDEYIVIGVVLFIVIFAMIACNGYEGQRYQGQRYQPIPQMTVVSTPDINTSCHERVTEKRYEPGYTKTNYGVSYTGKFLVPFPYQIPVRDQYIVCTVIESGQYIGYTDCFDYGADFYNRVNIGDCID